ncbi:hypothetical protein N7517_000868 [Penicillium concentricum]|uniref:Uncharacterized protein n=1 Tax=Penicillium concentricum TaxID=293559 RepID=A0A9W9SQU2_9EURO|nr:uncharacterized protein N7517_000868 [Penicillium concentricum]KAJ5382957.1 hypothetical protein N7517_000868 [Penicillium concentricum]
MHSRRSRQLKNRTQRWVTIQDLVPSLPAAPLTSPLFTVFPPEIRNRIYTLALESEDVLSDDNPHSVYQQNEFYYRPGYKQPKRIQTALLQTCQQIYGEASLLPPAINEHTFWFYRSPPHVNDASSPLNYFRKMTPKQRAQVQHIHLFTQQYFLEDNNWSQIWDGLTIGNDGPSLPGECRIAPKKITITLRHTDWWFWENNDPLGIDPFRPGRTRAAEMGEAVSPENAARSWGNRFSSIPCLEELVIEFETIMRKRDQLDAIIQQAFEWKFPVQADKGLYLVADFRSKSAYTWAGAKEAELKRQRRVGQFNIEAESESQSGQEQEPVLAAPALVPFDPQSNLGRTSDISLGDHPLLPDTNAEEFYVIFLTWKKQRVQE